MTMELIEHPAETAPPPTETPPDDRAILLAKSPDRPPGREDRRFVDPHIQTIVETWRIRQDMVRAQQKLTLQIKAICRRYCGGDKTEAARLYKSMQNGKEHPLSEAAHMACLGLLLARQPVEDQRKAYEKTLTALAKDLPIYHMVENTRGFGAISLAAIVGECGDLSAYKSISAVWKRLGLAVIDGGRQRRVAGDAALEHGYSPSRHAVIWTIADAMLKSQGKDDTAGPYRLIYDERKAYERPRVETDGHAHNRALRYMAKRLVKHLVQEWRK